MKKKQSAKNDGKLNVLFDRAKTVNHSIDNAKQTVKFVKKVVLPALMIGAAVVSYAVFDKDISGQDLK